MKHGPKAELGNSIVIPAQDLTHRARKIRDTHRMAMREGIAHFHGADENLEGTVVHRRHERSRPIRHHQGPYGGGFSPEG